MFFPHLSRQQQSRLCMSSANHKTRHLIKWMSSAKLLIITSPCDHKTRHLIKCIFFTRSTMHPVIKRDSFSVVIRINIMHVCSGNRKKNTSAKLERIFACKRASRTRPTAAGIFILMEAVATKVLCIVATFLLAFTSKLLASRGEMQFTCLEKVFVFLFYLSTHACISAVFQTGPLTLNGRSQDRNTGCFNKDGSHDYSPAVAFKSTPGRLNIDNTFFSTRKVEFNDLTFS